VDVDLLNEHVVRYAFAARLARGNYGYLHLPCRVEVNARLGASELESHRA
jgi:hypothetical protein